MSPSLDTHHLSHAMRRLARPGALVLAVIAAATAVVLVSSGPLASLLASRGESAGEAGVDSVDARRALAGRLEGYAARVTGRSMFFIPPAPRAEPPPRETRDPGPPPPPSRYEGPGIIAILGDAVWLDGGDPVRAGGEAVRGVEVVSVEAPWGATLRWKGVEFFVPLFERDAVVRPAPTSPQESAPAVEPEPRGVEPPQAGGEGSSDRGQGAGAAADADGSSRSAGQ